jgi:hypothetical protein
LVVTTSEPGHCASRYANAGIMQARSIFVKCDLSKVCWRGSDGSVP